MGLNSRDYGRDDTANKMQVSPEQSVEKQLLNEKQLEENYKKMAELYDEKADWKEKEARPQIDDLKGMLDSSSQPELNTDYLVNYNIADEDMQKLQKISELIPTLVDSINLNMMKLQNLSKQLEDLGGDLENKYGKDFLNAPIFAMQGEKPMGMDTIGKKIEKNTSRDLQKLKALNLFGGNKTSEVQSEKIDEGDLMSEIEINSEYLRQYNVSAEDQKKVEKIVDLMTETMNLGQNDMKKAKKIMEEMDKISEELTEKYGMEFMNGPMYKFPNAPEIKTRDIIEKDIEKNLAKENGMIKGVFDRNHTTNNTEQNNEDILVSQMESEIEEMGNNMTIDEQLFFFSQLLHNDFENSANEKVIRRYMDGKEYALGSAFVGVCIDMNLGDNRDENTMRELLEKYSHPASYKVTKVFKGKYQNIVPKKIKEARGIYLQKMQKRLLENPRFVSSASHYIATNPHKNETKILNNFLKSGKVG